MSTSSHNCIKEENSLNSILFKRVTTSSAEGRSSGLVRQQSKMSCLISDGQSSGIGSRSASANIFLVGSRGILPVANCQSTNPSA